MTRRRLILAIAAAVLLGTAWRLSLDRLSAEERLLIGMWTFEGASRTGHSCMLFSADRKSTCGWSRVCGSVPTIASGGRWYVHHGSLIFDR
jgi:hypothetical protein